jgi:hypothetical protein
MPPFDDALDEGELAESRDAESVRALRLDAGGVATRLVSRGARCVCDAV